MSKAIDRFLEVVDSAEQLPAVYRDEFRRLAEQPIHRIILCPPQEFPVRRIGWLGDLPFGWRLTPQRVLVFGDCHITVMTLESQGMVSAIHIPLEALVCIELATVLLRAHVRFAWARGNQIDTLQIDFNAVGELKMRRELDYVRCIMAARSSRAGVAGAGAACEHLPLKYYNYLKFSLIPGEQVTAVVFQPAIRHSRSLLRTYLSPNRAVALTNQAVIVVEDERRSPQPDYAVITRFLPLGHICTATVEVKDDVGWLCLELGTQTAHTDLSFPLLPGEAVRLRAALEDRLAQTAAA
jgi:hypothetical protein